MMTQQFQRSKVRDDSRESKTSRARTRDDARRAHESRWPGGGAARARGVRVSSVIEKRCLAHAGGIARRRDGTGSTSIARDRVKARACVRSQRARERERERERARENASTTRRLDLIN